MEMREERQNEADREGGRRIWMRRRVGGLGGGGA
jgi:hypothetical protein